MRKTRPVSFAFLAAASFASACAGSHSSNAPDGGAQSEVASKDAGGTKGDATTGRDGASIPMDGGDDAASARDAFGSAICVAGAACVTGTACTDSSGNPCTCQGPSGAAYVFCETPAADSGASSNADANNVAPDTDAGDDGPDAAMTACSGSSPLTTGATAQVSLVVDASQQGAAWSRYYEKAVASDHANTVLSTAWNRNTQNAMRKAHNQAGFNYIRFHGILDSDIGVYTEQNGTPAYVWTRFDEVYDAIVAAGMRPIFEVSFMPPPLASDPSKTLQWYNGAPAVISPPKDWTKWTNLMAAIVTHLEGRYGAAEVRNNWYFEIWNEASWMYSLGEAGYPQLYSYTAKGLLQGDPQLQIGGPAASSASTPEQMNSLVSYTKSNKLPLDFITYHVYGSDNTSLGNDNANEMLAFHETVANTAKQLGFAGPIWNDEFGGTSSADISRDTEVAASFIAKTIHLIGTDANVPPPVSYGYWAISDLYEEFNSGNALAYREGNYGLMLKGDSRYPQSFDLAKPAFNAFRLLHMMGDTRLQTSGGTTSDGVNAVATISADKSAVQILVYNHVNGGMADPTTSTLVKLTVSKLPFTASTVKVRQYVVDHTHSNSHTVWASIGKPQQPSSDQWTTLRAASELCYYDTTAVLSGDTWTVWFPQNVYSVSLIVLTP
jgi:xylan 1,4-beta-xylosidase